MSAPKYRAPNFPVAQNARQAEPHHVIVMMKPQRARRNRDDACLLRPEKCRSGLKRHILLAPCTAIEGAKYKQTTQKSADMGLPGNTTT